MRLGAEQSCPAKAYRISTVQVSDNKARCSWSGRSWDRQCGVGTTTVRAQRQEEPWEGNRVAQVRRKNPEWQARLAEGEQLQDSVAEALAMLGMQLNVSHPRMGKTTFPHWQVRDGRGVILHYWPTKGTWWCTIARGAVRDATEIPELAMCVRSALESHTQVIHHSVNVKHQPLSAALPSNSLSQCAQPRARCRGCGQTPRKGTTLCRRCAATEHRT